MSVLQRLLSTLCPCAGLRSDDAGTWTSASVPLLSFPVTVGELDLPQNAGCLGRELRGCSTRTSRCLYVYGKVADLDAPWAAGLSALLALPPDWALGQYFTQRRARHNQRAVTAELGDSGQFRSWEDFKKLFQEFPVPPVAADWRSDRVYADQLLAGFDPITLARVTEEGAGRGASWPALRSKLNPATIAALERSLNGDVAQGVARGRLFVADYQGVELAGTTEGAQGALSGRPPLAPIAIFVRPPKEIGMQPVAIQLGQDPTAPVQYPDGSADWLAARAWAQQAAYALTQVVYHLTQHHVIAEALALATPRRLPQQHPLYALLIHHVSGTLPVNVGTVSEFFDVATQSYMFLGREAGYRLINAHYQRWSFDDLDFPKRLEQRAVEDWKLLPYFPQRDDGLLYWALIDDFLRDYLAVFYGQAGTDRADAAVAADTELQDWAAELSREAGGKGNLAGFPARITSLDMLHQVLLRLIFTVGPHHASLNFAQLHYGGFVPNMPALIELPPPEGAVEGTAEEHRFDERDLLNALPGVGPAGLQNEMTYKAAYWMGSFLDYADFFCGGGRNAQARRVVQRHHGELERISATIEARNQERARAGHLTYDLLLPGNVPNSVSA